MKRRTVLELLGSAGMFAMFPRYSLSGELEEWEQDRGGELESAFSRLRGEKLCRAEIRNERGGPRLFINDRETYPFLALSDELLKTAAAYRDSGISMFTPILGLNVGWIAPGKYDWSGFDLFFVEMDPTTYIEPKKAGEGGSGHDSVAGSVKIIRRNLGQMFARGVGGWFFDFGHLCPPLPGRFPSPYLRGSEGGFYFVDVG